MVKINKILVPVDGSKSSAKGFDIAITIAKATNAKIMALHIIKSSNDFNFQISPEIKTKQLSTANKIIDAFKKKAEKQNIEFVGKVTKGSNIGKEIIKFAKEKKVNFIIIGSRGPDPGAEAFFGSVANYVLHKSKIPTTIVK